EDAEANLLLARRAVDEIYTPVAEQLTSVPLMQPYQRDILEKALPFYQVFARRQGRDPILRREATGALLRVGLIHNTLGHPRGAKGPWEAALAGLEALAAELPAASQRRALLGSAYSLRGTLLIGIGGSLAAPPLPHHRAYGSVPRRFARVKRSTRPP